MFYVIYEFEVFLEKEKEFVSTWHALTLKIQSFYGGLGSRLHKLVSHDHIWIAYAKWPDRETWLTRTTRNEELIELRNSLMSFCKSMRTVYELQMVDDLLI